MVVQLMVVRCRLNLSSEEILAILNEADTNNDNQIDYQEFVPCIQNLVQRQRQLQRVL